MKPKPRRLLYVFEYAQNGGEFEPFFREMEKRLAADGIESFGMSGLFREYGPGSSFKRVANLLYMYALFPFRLARTGAGLVLVRTTPPLMQMVCAIWAGLMRRKTALWLMDYHPVFGMRESKNPVARKIWGALGRIDKMLLSKYAMIICLDRAMQNLVLERCPSAKTCVIPTWKLQETERLNLEARGPFEPLRLLYSGNLGAGHSLEAYGRLLGLLREKVGKVEISYCGNAKAAIAKFEKLAENCGVSFKNYSRVDDYRDMGGLYRDNGIHYGVALLNDSLQGVVSPSKFGGYISFGLPLLYLGPKHTNAWSVCQDFGAGVSWSRGEDMEAVAARLADPRVQQKCAAATEAADRHFSSLQAENAARELIKLLPRG